MEEILKCKICKLKYNNDIKEPLILKCGHTFCRTCLSYKSEDTSCPLCGLNVTFDLNSLISNKIVFEMINSIQNGMTSPSKILFNRENESSNQKVRNFQSYTKIDSKISSSRGKL